MIEYLNSFSKLEFDKVKNHIKRYTVSEIAREKLDHLIPTNQIEQIKERLNLISEMKRLIESDDPLPLVSFKDIRTLLSRAAIQDNILSSNEILFICNVLRISRLIVSYFNKRKSIYPHLNQLIKDIHVNKILEFNIEQTIDENGQIKDNASVELYKIRREINEKSEYLRKKVNQILKNLSDLGWTQEDLVTTRDGRMVIPVKIENKNKIPGFIHSISASGATAFIEPAETLEMNNEIRSLHFQEIREIEKILKELTIQIGNTKDAIKKNVDILGDLDFLQAAANYSIEIIGSAPQITDDQNFMILNARHPILLMKHRYNDVVPISIELGKNYTTLIITGPNAGGKSVAIKTYGLLIIMAQSGLHIPASPDTTLSIYDKIFVDIGDEQSIEADLSTFTSHIKNIKIILENSDNKSLVLIDEIGSGTDPIEGSAIAQSLLKELTERKTHCLVTTHHGTLKAFAHEIKGIENAAMEFNHETLKPTYKFIAGIPGSSYAIEIAKRAGLPEKFITLSTEYRSSQGQSLEKLLVDLESKNQELEVELNLVKSEREKLENLISEYTSRLKKLEKDVKEIRFNALNEAKSILLNANSLIERTIQELRETQAKREVIKKSREELAKKTQEITEEMKNIDSSVLEEKQIVQFKVGDIVRLISSNEIGEIIEIINENYFNVIFGQLKIKVNKNNLIKANYEEQRKFEKKIKIEVSSIEIKNEIDLRGLYGDEAIMMLDKYIDSAILKGYHRIDIIHGKGTGALQRKVAEFLKSHSMVKSFRLGEWNEGGYGVTVVELK